ncbi:MAG: hypothetical protein J6C81_00900 [Muribaculaceae bacterium]|nr:hypothetical protein [Muribaculaceae bacterium]
MMDKLKFYFAGISVPMLVLMMTACSSDEPANNRNAEFDDQDTVLNSHLANDREFDILGAAFAQIFFWPDGKAEEARYAYANLDVVEIPVEGGAFDFVIHKSWVLENIATYEDMPFLSHNRSDYTDAINGECYAYGRLISKRNNPDSSIDLKGLRLEDCPNLDIMDWDNDDINNCGVLTYTFPENNTGKYRLIVLNFISPYPDMADPSNPPTMLPDCCYFIQMPK